jgi:ATP-dependent DNA helicase PIF1
MFSGNQERKVVEPVTWHFSQEQCPGITTSRTQVPLILSWATIVHRAQGLSLDRLVVDCREVFSSGQQQLYAALSSVRSPAGLKLVVLTEDSILPLP